MNIFPANSNKSPKVAGGLYAAKPPEAWNGDESEYWGTPTGHDFLVLDIDVKGIDGRKSIEDKPMPNTYTVRTQSGGLHYYFKPVEGAKNKAGVLPGVDIRGVGGYVIIPPSPGYEVINDVPMAEAPEWLIALVKPRPQASTAPVSPGEAVVMEGGRNHYLTQVAGRMQRANILTLEGLLAVNERDCTPPLDESEVNLIFNSVQRYAPSAPIVPQESPLVWASSLANEMFAYLKDKDKVKGEPTLMSGLDEMLGGGKRLGELTVTLGVGKTGKNTLWHKLMYLWLAKGHKIAYASRELSPDTEVLPNILSIHFQENYWLKKSYDQEAAVKAIQEWRLAFAPGYGAMEPPELFSWMDACRDAGIKYFFIDHLHYMMLDPEDFKAISKLIRDIKSYAKRHEVHIDLIVQPKLQEDGVRLSLNSLRGGASIGQALDNLLILTREKDAEGRPTNVVRVTLEVARSKLAKPGFFFLQYDRSTCDFQEVVPDTDQNTDEEDGPITPTQATAVAASLVRKVIK